MMLGKRFFILGLLLTVLAGCTAAKVATKAVTLPAKMAWETGKLAGKTVWYTGKGTYYVGKYGGKGLIYVGSVPVQITQAALDTTAELLSITTSALDLSGQLITLNRIVPTTQLERELRALDASIRAMRSIREIIAVTVDIVS